MPSGAEVRRRTPRTPPQWLSDATGAERLLEVCYTSAGRVIVDGSCGFLARPGQHEHDSAVA